MYKVKMALMKGSSGGNVLIIIITFCTIFSCKKTNVEPKAYQLSYGDSILYLKNQSSDYIVYPADPKTGQYFGFPDGIDINETTGAINVSKSETGLRYRITYVSPQGDTSKTTIVISGINFTDRFYHLSQGDSIAFPIYNASIERALPVSGSSFDEGNTANSGGCSVKTDNAQINLLQTIRNGVFGTVPQNDAHQEFDIYYRLNDKSEKALNKIRVKIYYYNTMSDVAPDLLQTLQDRENDGVFLGTSHIAIPNNSFNFRLSLVSRTTKPRPPCVIIIAN